MFVVVVVIVVIVLVISSSSSSRMCCLCVCVCVCARVYYGLYIGSGYGWDIEFGCGHGMVTILFKVYRYAFIFFIKLLIRVNNGTETKDFYSGALLVRYLVKFCIVTSRNLIFTIPSTPYSLSYSVWDVL